MLSCRGLVRRPIFPTSGSHSKRLALMVVSHSVHFLARRGICQLQSNDNFHKMRLRTPAEIKRGLQILFSILRKPSLAGQLRELKLDRTPLLSHRGDPYEIRPTQVLLPPEDLQRLQLAVRNAGFDGQGEHEQVMNMLLQDVSKPRRYANYSIIER